MGGKAAWLAALALLPTLFIRPLQPQEGNVWEKAGVAVSVVYGSMPAESYRVAVGRDIPFEQVRL